MANYLPINSERKLSKRYAKRELLFKILVIGDFGVGEYLWFSRFTTIIIRICLFRKNFNSAEIR